MLDIAGQEMTIASQAAVGAWDATVEHFLAHGRETAKSLDAVFEADPQAPLAWCAKGLFACLLARAELNSIARDALMKAEQAAAAVGPTPRERAYIEALRQATEGSFTGAIAMLEGVLDDHPADSFAAKLSHAMRFMLGDSRGMRESIERVLARCAPDHPHRGYLLGCRAFGLEETGAYGEALSTGYEAILRAPRDAWGLHAVSHVHEMTGRIREGAEFLETHQANIAHCNNFGYHVFWHLALFRLEQGDTASTLRLYDERIRADKTDDFRDIANAASLLRRLVLAGIDVGPRWEELADIAARRIADRTLVFAGLHYLLALLGAGRVEAAGMLVRGLTQGAVGDQKRVGQKVGAAAAEALLAYEQRRYADCATGLLELRPQLEMIGGSHAQRDIFEQVLVEAAVRAGLQSTARTLLYERLAHREGNRFAAARLARLRPPLASQRPRTAAMPL